MTDNQLVKLIREAVADEFEKHGIKTLRQQQDMTIRRRVELLLGKYRQFQRLIEEKEAQIAELEHTGIPERSPSIVEFSPHSGNSDGVTTDSEALQMVLGSLREDVVWIKHALRRVDLALEATKNHKWYKYITLYYFDDLTLDEIASQDDVSSRTILNRINRVIDELGTRLFVQDAFKDDVLSFQIFEQEDVKQW